MNNQRNSPKSGLDRRLPGFVTVRFASTRLPGKCMMRLGGETVLSHVIRRCMDADIRPIVCTTTGTEDDVIAKLAEDMDVETFRGASVNKMKRWADCASAYNVDYFHTIDADDPFFDEEEIKISMALLVKNELDVVYPSASSSNGGASVGYSIRTNLLRKALIGINNDNVDTEMMWAFLERVESLKKGQLPDATNLAPKMRLTLDYPEDYWMLCTVVEILGRSCQRSEINDLFKNNPDLHKINFFRNVQWKKNQEDKVNRG